LDNRGLIREPDLGFPIATVIGSEPFQKHPRKVDRFNETGFEGKHNIWGKKDEQQKIICTDRGAKIYVKKGTGKIF